MYALIEPVVVVTAVGLFVAWGIANALGLADEAFDKIANRKR